MQGFLKRTQLNNELKKLLKSYPAVALLGARQTGKTVLAKHLLSGLKKTLYLDLQSSRDLNKLSDPEAFFYANKDSLICLDEIQHKPYLFSTLRAVIDQKRQNGRFLILGSAGQNLIQKSSETLAGRIAFLDITPFSAGEINGAKKFHQHWLRGGYPLSFLSKTDGASLEWRYNYIRTFLERDIPQLGVSISAPLLDRFWKMLSHSQGKTLNSSQFGKALGKSAHTIKHYIDVLEQTFVLRSLKPYIRNTKKRLVKAPKIYIRDTGLLHAHLNIETMNELFGHPIYGASYESYVIENICYHLRKWNHYFYRTGAGAEIDLVLEKAGKKTAVEIKASSSPKISKGFWSAVEDIKADKKYIIAPVEQAYPVKGNVQVLNLFSFLKQFGIKI